MKVNYILKNLITILLLCSIIASVILFKEYGNVASLHLYIRSFGLWAPIIFVLLYMLGTVSLLPTACMSFIGGYVFGFPQGLILNILGSSLGVMVAFLIGRYLAKGIVRKHLDGKANRLIASVEKMGWKFVAIFRLTPLVPFDILNFAFGITNIKVIQYLWSSMLFMLPGVVTYTYFGKLGLDLIISQPRFLALKGLVGLAIIATVLYVLFKVLAVVRQKFISEDMENSVNEIYRTK